MTGGEILSLVKGKLGSPAALLLSELIFKTARTFLISPVFSCDHSSLLNVGLPIFLRQLLTKAPLSVQSLILAVALYLCVAFKSYSVKCKKESRQTKPNHFTVAASLRPRIQTPPTPSRRIAKALLSVIGSEASWCTRRKSPFGAAGLALDFSIQSRILKMISERRII